MKVLFRSYELDTAYIIIGSYIEENGFYMTEGVPDYEKPCTRHKICDEDGIYHEVAPEYLSISFEDMKDSNDKPIFASLSKSGKGGDMIHYNPRDKNTWTAVYNESRFQWVSKNELTFNPLGRVEYLRLCPSEKEVIGIQNDT